MKKLIIVLMALIITFTLSACEELYYQEYSVSGIVEDESGNGIENVEVIFDGNEKITTNTEGQWSKRGLTGSVRISFNKDKYNFNQSVIEVNSAKDLTVVGSFTGSTDEGEGGESVTTYNLSGTITDKNDNPLEEVTIRFDKEGYSSVKTDIDGKWNKSVSESVVVTPEKSGWKFEPENRSIDSDDEYVNFKGINVDYKASGTVEDSIGNPLTDITISFSNGETTKTGTDGNWSKSGLEGKVTIKPESEEYTFAPSTKDITEKTTGIVFTGTKKSYEVAGIVEDNDGNPIPNVTLNFSDGSASVKTGTEGKWQKAGLTGEITIVPELENWKFKPSNITVTSIDNKREDIDFIGELSEEYSYYQASGEIIDSDGNGVSSILIEFVKNKEIIGYAVTKDDGSWIKENLWGTVTVSPDSDSKVGFNSFLPENQEISNETSNVDFIAK